MPASSLFSRWKAASKLRAFGLALAVLAATHPAAAQRSQCLAAHADAQMLRMKGQLQAAREKLLVCGQTKCPTPIANDCAGWLSEVDSSLSSVVFAVSDSDGRDLPDVRVSTGGNVLVERTDGRALVLDPGTYTFTFETPGYVSAEQTVSMRQSEKNRIVRVLLSPIPPPSAAGEPAPESSAEIAAPRQEAPRPAAASTSSQGAHVGVPLATYILGGTTLLGAGTFIYFGLTGESKKREVERCETHCDPLVSAGKRDYVIADIGLAVMIASAPAALLVYLLRPEEEPRALTHLQPMASPTGVGLRWSGSF